MASNEEPKIVHPAYEPPFLTVIGSVDALTLSSRNGSFSDFNGRSVKKL